MKLHVLQGIKNKMPHQVTIYHNPRCSTSRKTLALLESQGLTPIVIEYLNDPPSIATLKKILHMLQLKPRDLLRRKEAVYQALHLDAENMTDAALLKAMHTHPILIERPIVIIDHQARIGRPPETILEILPIDN